MPGSGDIVRDLRAANIEKIFSNLPKKLPIFVGRQDVMKQIETILLKNSAVAISAFAGTGKSSTAIEYGHKMKEEGALVRFITAATPDKLNISYRELAKELGINLNLCMDNKNNLNMEEVFRLVHQKSAVKADNVLFIFDNVEKYSNIEKLVLSLGNSPIKAIITTRDKIWLPEARSNIRLEPLCKAEATDYITKALGRSLNDNATGKLAEFLTSEDGLIIPHKMGKAVAFLQNNKFWSVEKYIDYLTNNPDEDEYILLFEQIAEKPIAWNILQYASFLDPDFIDIEILRGLKLGDDLELEDATKELEKLSLASIEYSRDGKQGIKIHRLLQEKLSDCFTIRKDMMSDKDELVANLLLTLSKLMPYIEYIGLGDQWEQIEKIYPHVKYLFQNCNINLKTKDVADLLSKMGQYQFLVMNDFDSALNWCKQALEIYQSLGNDTTSDIASSLNNLGNIYWSKRQYDEALKCYKKSLAIREKVYKEDHPSISTSLNNLGTVYYYKKQYDEALKCYKKSFTIDEKLYKEDHPDIGDSLNNLGTVYWKKRQYDEALKYHKKSLAIREKLYKEDHPDIGDSLNNLGSVYYSKEQYDEALKYFQKSLVICEKVYKEDHPCIAASLNNLGTVYYSKEQYDEALKYYKEALAIDEKIYKEDHPDIADSLNNLGTVYWKKRQYDEALKYHKKSLAIRKKIYKEDHPDIASSLNNLGTVYYSKEQYDKALKYFQKSLAIKEKVYKEDHPCIAASLNNLGLVYAGIGQHDGALRYLQKSLAIREKIYKGDHHSIAKSLDKLNILFNYLGYKYKADSYLNMKKIISSPDDFLDKPIINLFSDAEDKERTSRIITKLPITLNRVAEETSKANWSLGRFISKATPILGDRGVKVFTDKSCTKEKLGDLYSTNNVKVAKLLCFEAICLGIASQSSGRKNYKCLDEFIKINPGIADIVLKQHPEYFVNTNLLQHCKDYIQDKKLLSEVLESANNMFKTSEVEVKDEDMEDEENIIITNDYDENNDASSSLFGE